MKSTPIALILGLLLVFAALAHGAHDLWAATLVHLAVLSILIIQLFSFQKSDERPVFRVPFWPLCVGVIAVCWLSFRQAVNPSESFQTFTDVLACLVLFIAAHNAFKEEEAENSFLRVIVPCLWVQALLSVTQMALRWSPEAASSLINPNVLAGFTLFWVPLLWSKYQSSDGFFKKICLSGLIACTISLCASRSALAWLLVMAWIGHSLFQKNRVVLVGLGVVALSLLIFKLRPSSPVFDRLSWWEAGLRMFVHHPLIGIGLGNFPSAFLAYKQEIGLNTRFAHSSVVSILAEAGLLGAVVIGAFFVLWWRSIRKSPYKTGVVLFLLFSLASLGIEYFVNLMTLAIFMGMSTAKTSIGKGIHLRLSHVIVATALAIAALPALVSPFLASRHSVEGYSLLIAGDRDNADKHFDIAIGLDSRTWEPYRGRAASAFSRYQETKDETRLKEALSFQTQALNRNQLNLDLQRDLRRYFELAQKVLSVSS